MLILLYSSGLRVSELVKLKIKDIDLKHKLCFVRSGKGGKDRFTILSEYFIKNIKEYLVDRKPDEYLFLGRKGHLTSRSVQMIFQNSRFHPHSFRAGFATHLIEDNISIFKIKKLLGHSHIETTMGYINTSNLDILNIKSPMDKK